MAEDKRIRKKNFSADELKELYEAQRNVTIKIYKQPHKQNKK